MFIKKEGRGRPRDDRDNRDNKRTRRQDEQKGRRPPTPPKEDKPIGIIHTISRGIEKDKAENLHKRRKVNRSVLKIDYKEHKEEKWT